MVNSHEPGATSHESCSVKTEIQVNIMPSQKIGILSCIRHESSAEVVWKLCPILAVYDLCMTFCTTFLMDTWQNTNFLTELDNHLNFIFTESYESRAKVKVCIQITSIPLDSPFLPRAKHVDMLEASLGAKHNTKTTSSAGDAGASIWYPRNS